MIPSSIQLPRSLESALHQINDQFLVTLHQSPLPSEGFQKSFKLFIAFKLCKVHVTAVHTQLSSSASERVCKFFRHTGTQLTLYNLVSWIACYSSKITDHSLPSTLPFCNPTDSHFLGLLFVTSFLEPSSISIKNGNVNENVIIIKNGSVNGIHYK